MRKRSKREIIFERIPPAISLVLILLPVVGSLLFPQVAMYIIILFNVYFLYKSISMFFLFLIGFFRIREAEQIDWMYKLRELDDIDAAIAKHKQAIEKIRQKDFSSQLTDYLDENKRVKVPRFLLNFVYRIEQRKAIGKLQDQIEKLQYLQQSGQDFKYDDLHHVIMIPHWKEPLGVLDQTVKAISKSHFPTKQISVLMAAEARDSEGVSKSEQLREKYGDKFENFWISNHELQEDEIIGKSSNMAWAGKHAAKKIKKLGWDLTRTTMTSCDADSVIPAQYFAKLTYEYITDPDSKYKYYLGAIIFYSNIWRLKFYARVKNSLSVLYNISQQVRTDKLVPFSTYSVSFWLIDKIGYWTPWVTPEDYHLYFKGLFHFPDKVGARPLYLRILSDSAEGETHMETFKNNYFQSRRWSWGISDDGWVLENLARLAKRGKLNLRTLYKGLHVLFDHIIGPATTLAILVGANLPTLLNPSFAGTVSGVNLPKVSSFMIRTTLWFMIIMIIVDHYFLKPKKVYKSIKNRIFALVEWAVLPYIGFLIVFLPTVEAHTRLLFGKYLEYYLTKKKA